MIVGERIYLRSVEEADLELLTCWRNNPLVWRNFFTPFLFSMAGQRRWYEDLLNNPAKTMFMVVTPDGHQTIGATGLDHIDHRQRQAEMGPILVDPQEWGKGYAPDINNAVLHYGFGELNLQRIYVKSLAWNQPAIRACKRSGLKVEATLRQAAFVDGQFQDVVLLAILREEWEAGRSQPT